MQGGKKTLVKRNKGHRVQFKRECLSFYALEGRRTNSGNSYGFLIPLLFLSYLFPSSLLFYIPLRIPPPFAFVFSDPPSVVFPDFRSNRIARPFDSKQPGRIVKFRRRPPVKPGGSVKFYDLKKLPCRGLT